MLDAEGVRRIVEKALAFANAAMEEPSPNRVAEAKKYAARVLPSLAEATAKGVALGDARMLIDSVGQLRAVLHVAERKSALEEQSGSN